MNTTMELTDVEVAIIEEHRRKAQKEIEQRRLRLKLLKVAADLEAWMQETGSGATYSTFCDDFGYEADIGEDRPKTYNAIGIIIGTAYDIAENME